MLILDKPTISLLQQLAAKYETLSFINDDPSWFMHQVSGRHNQETIAFLASCLSYGSRKQFIPKIQMLFDFAHGDVYEWVKTGSFNADVPPSAQCFYRLYNYEKMNSFLAILSEMMSEYGSIGEFAQAAIYNKVEGKSDVVLVLEALGSWFADRGMKGIVPKPFTSLCKRPVMFMRWMVRDGSPVDLGLWADFIDKRNLYIPMDTHVVQMSQRIGLLPQSAPSWKSVEQLRLTMLQAFADDPAKGDFALFGYDVDNNSKQ